MSWCMIPRGADWGTGFQSSMQYLMHAVDSQGLMSLEQFHAAHTLAKDHTEAALPTARQYAIEQSLHNQLMQIATGGQIMPRHSEINPLHKEFNAKEQVLQELVKDKEALEKKNKDLEAKLRLALKDRTDVEIKFGKQEKKVAKLNKKYEVKSRKLKVYKKEIKSAVKNMDRDGGGTRPFDKLLLRKKALGRRTKAALTKANTLEDMTASN